MKKAILVILGLVAVLQGQAPQNEIKTFHVQGNVYMLVGAGGNIAVQTGDEGVLVVDTGIAQTRDKVLAAIRQLSTKPIRWMINTHAHPDHTGGNETVSQAGLTVNGNPAAIIAHENVLARMTEASRPVTERPLNTFFEDERDFYFNGEAIFIHHIPHAHTDGDVLVYFRGDDLSGHRRETWRRSRGIRHRLEQDARHHRAQVSAGGRHICHTRPWPGRR